MPKGSWKKFGKKAKSPPSTNQNDVEYMFIDTDEEDNIIKQSKQKVPTSKNKPTPKKNPKHKHKSKSKKPFPLPPVENTLIKTFDNPFTNESSTKPNPFQTSFENPFTSNVKTPSPFESILQKLIMDNMTTGTGIKKGPVMNTGNNEFVMQFVIGEDDEEDSDYKTDDEDEDDDEEEEDAGNLFSNMMFGGQQKKNPYDIRIPASKMTPELLKYLKEMPKILGTKSKSGDDIKGFRSLKKAEQKQIISSLKQIIQKQEHKEHPYLQILRLPIDPDSKRSALEKQKQIIDAENSPMKEPNTKLQNWIRGFLKIPFGKYISIPKRAIKNPEEYLTKASRILDKEVYGLDDAKDHILRYVAQSISNQNAAGNCIAMLGPAGTGKTSLIKNALGKILNRPVHMISLGGNSDSSYLNGHSYTFEGSLWGEIVDILMRSQCMNPVIILDELDKVSRTSKGEEIISLLTHITDSTQNQEYKDKYFAGINIDLSRVLFVFTMNDASSLNSILADRLRIIHTKGYSRKEKRIIGEQYLLPKIMKEYNISNLNISEEAWNYIIAERDEAGVRNLKRDIETIVSRLNIYRLMRGNKVIKGIPSNITWSHESSPNLNETDTKTLLGDRNPGSSKLQMSMYS